MVTSSLTIDEIDEAKEREDLKTLEAVFFVSGRFLNIQELISLSDLNPIVIKDLIEKLKEKFSKEESALEIIEKNGLWKMDVKPDYEHLVNKLATGSSEFTKAEQETLAIIAFKQPIKQSVIVKIRGNKAYDHIKKFASIGLIKKKKMGHTHELSLSDDFYDYFNISEQERENVPEMNKKIKQQIESAEREVEQEENGKVKKNEMVEENAEDKDRSVEDVIERIEEQTNGPEDAEDIVETAPRDTVSGAEDIVEEVIEEEKAVVDNIIEETAPGESSNGGDSEKAEEVVKEVVEEVLDEDYEKIKEEIGASSDKFQEPVEGYVDEEEVMDDLKKIS